MYYYYYYHIFFAFSHEKEMQKRIAAKQAEIEAMMKRSEECDIEMAPTVHSDTSDAVKRALEASRIHGSTSVEARMAWEEVEELDASNSHHKPSDVHVASPADCTSVVTPVVEVQKKTAKAAAAAPQTVDEAIKAALFLSKVYGNHASESRLAWELVEELEAQESHKRSQEKVALLEKQAAVVASVKIPVAEAVHVDSASAIKAAMAASEKYGGTSKEARIAWELVEELDATNSHHKTVGSG